MASDKKTSKGKNPLPSRKTIKIPKATIEIRGGKGFRIVLDKIQKQILFDQGSEMTSAGQGCISSPTGPTC